jgi:Protein of unknown function (DUF3592)
MVEMQEFDLFLRQQPPRAIPDSMRSSVLRGRARFRIGLMIGTIACAIMAAVFFPWSIVRDVRLNIFGIPTQGVVTESFHAGRTVGDNIVMRRQQVFVVRFRFKDQRLRDQLAGCLMDRYLPPGTKVDIEFLPSNPHLARIKGGFFVPGGLLELIWGAMFGVLPLFGFWSYTRWCRSRLKLLSHGVCVPGQILRAWREDPKDETRGWIEVSFEAIGGPVRLSQMVESKAYLRACDIIERSSAVRILHAQRSPREHLILELMD